MTKKVDFDNYTGNYNELLRESTKFFSSSESYFAAYKIELVRANTQPIVRRILEYGCGIGRNIEYLRKAFPNVEVVGTDISEASLAIASAENPDVRFEIERPGLDLGQFDLIFVAGVFHHIAPAKRIEVCKVLASRLATSGALFVFEHNPFNPVTRRIVSSCPYDADAVLLKPAELGDLLAQANLTTTTQAYCLFIPPTLAKLASVEKYLSWLPLGGQYWIKANHSI